MTTPDELRAIFERHAADEGGDCKALLDLLCLGKEVHAPDCPAPVLEVLR